MRKAVALLVLALSLLGLTASIVQAELSASGNLFVVFHGGIIPNALPRHERAPITIWMSGKVRTLLGEQPPSLRRITIAMNREGHLETRGLPRCRMIDLATTTTAEARAACSDAMVGSGTYRARTTFPEQAQSPSFGRILAFNGRMGGRPIILAQVYGQSPVRSTNVIVFRIRHPKGPFGTVLSGTLPSGLTRWGYLKRISLRLDRSYTFRGRRLSYISASCGAPAGLNEAAFKFVYVSLKFDDGRRLAANLTRTCRVRK